MFSLVNIGCVIANALNFIQNSWHTGSLRDFFYHFFTLETSWSWMVKKEVSGEGLSRDERHSACHVS